MVHRESSQTLASYLSDRVFGGEDGVSVQPEAEDVEGFNRFMKLYKAGLAIERAAVDVMK